MKDDAISREMALGAVCGALIGTKYQRYAVSAIKLIPALEDVPVKHDEELGTSLIHVEDIDDWQDRIILLEDGSKSCAVYYADAEEEPAVWEMVEKEAFWIGDEEIWMETGKPTIRKMPRCSKCKTGFGTGALAYKHCPECGTRIRATGGEDE